MNKLTLAFAGGGTGGHLFPGISLAKAFQRRLGDRAEIIFLGTRLSLDERIVAQYGFELLFAGLDRRQGGLLGKLKFFSRLPFAVWTSYRLLKKRGVRALVALGGFASFAPAVAAHFLGIPVFQLEQNAIPGQVTRLLASRSRMIFMQMPDRFDHLKKCKSKPLAGNPLRFDAIPPVASRPEWMSQLPKNAPTVSVLGGSQGAKRLNELMAEAAPILKSALPHLQILHIAGDRDYEMVRALYAKNNVEATVRGFTDEMDHVYDVSDLVISRSGATTLAELAAFGKPSVLIPFPFAKDNHQHYNALEFSERNAAILLEEKSLNGKILADNIISMLKDRERLGKMASAARSLGKPSAADDIAAQILGVLES